MTRPPPETGKPTHAGVVGDLLRGRVNLDQADDALWALLGVQPGDQAAERVADQDVAAVGQAGIEDP
jgi:hypothetical protein